MTHLYTILVAGLVIPGGYEPDVSAIAWAGDIVLALGNDDDVMAISRGDSRFVELRGAVVVALGESDDSVWPPEATLEVGGRADLAVLNADPRAGPFQTVALVRGGHVVQRALPLPVAWPDSALSRAIHRSD